MPLDAVIISSYKDDTISHSSRFRLQINNRLATIQRIKAFIKNNDSASFLKEPISDRLNFHHSIKLSGITIFSYLSNYFQCDVIDFMEYEEVRLAKLLKQAPRFVIISTSFIFNKKSLLEITTKIKKLCRDTIIIAGGPFVLSSYLLYERRDDHEYDTDSPQDDFLFLNEKDEPLVDYYIIANQGLDTLLKLMQTLSVDKSIQNIPNIAYRQDDGFTKFNSLSLNNKYEYIKIGWSKLPKHLFSNGVASLQASNGCPFECAFCNFVKDKRANFIRTIDDVIDDMFSLQNMGVRYVRFADDNFRLGRPDLNQFCKKIIERGIHIKWHSFMRLGNLKGANLELLKKAGCVEVLFGLESASSSILKNMNKRVNPSIYKDMIQRLISAGINVAATFIIGFPGETEKTAQETFDLIESIDLSGFDATFKWSLFPFTLLPGSPIYNPAERQKYGLHGYMQSWHHDTMDSDTATSIINKGYMEIGGVGPGYTSDNLSVNVLCHAYKKSCLQAGAFMLTGR